MKCWSYAGNTRLKCNFRKAEFLKYINCLGKKILPKEFIRQLEIWKLKSSQKELQDRAAIQKAVEDLVWSEGEVRISSKYFLQL